jgi:uncharacterized small protein (DUF1192 family)
VSQTEWALALFFVGLFLWGESHELKGRVAKLEEEIKRLQAKPKQLKG